MPTFPTFVKPMVTYSHSPSASSNRPWNPGGLSAGRLRDALNGAASLRREVKREGGTEVRRSGTGFVQKNATQTVYGDSPGRLFIESLPRRNR